MYWIIKLGKRELRGTCYWYQWQRVVIERVQKVSLLTVKAESASCAWLLNCAVCVWLRSQGFCSQMQLQRGEVQMPRGETQWFLADPAPWMQTPKSISIGPPECGYTAGKDSSTDRISPVGESDGPIMLMREDVRNAWELLISSVKESQWGTRLLSGEFPPEAAQRKVITQILVSHVSFPFRSLPCKNNMNSQKYFWQVYLQLGNQDHYRSHHFRWYPSWYPRNLGLP